MSTTAIKRGETFERRRTGYVRTVAGFTTKPSADSPSDGVRRARMIDPTDPSNETRVRVDQLLKSYRRI